MPPQPPGNTPSGRKQRSIHAEAADENAKAVHDKERQYGATPRQQKKTPRQYGATPRQYRQRQASRQNEKPTSNSRSKEFFDILNKKTTNWASLSMPRTSGPTHASHASPARRSVWSVQSGRPSIPASSFMSFLKQKHVVLFIFCTVLHKISRFLFNKLAELKKIPYFCTQKTT